MVYHTIQQIQQFTQLPSHSKLASWSERENQCIKIHLFSTSTSVYKNVYSVFSPFGLEKAVFDQLLQVDSSQAKKKQNKTEVALCVFRQVKKSMVELQM